MSEPSSSTSVPVTIRPDAAARVAELGMQTELQQMIDHARQVVLDLAAIEVEVAERYETGGEPGVSIVAYSDTAFDNTSEEVRGWAVTTFPPQVLQHLSILLTPGGAECRVELSSTWPAIFSPRPRNRTGGRR
ncbi:MAG: hypothetical protein ACRELG_27325 [Gemmataceae bacterium]